MNRKILLILVMLFLLAGCGRSKPPEVQSFEGQTVATLQTPASMADLVATPESKEQEVLPAAEQASDVTPDEILPPDREQPSNDIPELPYPLDNPDTATPSFTTTLITPVWAGPWNIWYQRGTGNYDMAVLTLAVSGNEVNGTATFGVIDYFFKGIIQADQSQVEGDWNDGQQEGKFWWQMNSENVFLGSREARFGFCGNRKAAVQPQNCRKISP